MALVLIEGAIVWSYTVLLGLFFDAPIRLIIFNVTHMFWVVVVGYLGIVMGRIIGKSSLVYLVSERFFKTSMWGGEPKANAHALTLSASSATLAGIACRKSSIH